MDDRSERNQTAREHNEAQFQRFQRFQREPSVINNRHEKCPEGAVKIAAGAYDCGDMFFVGDRD